MRFSVLLAAVALAGCATHQPTQTPHASAPAALERMTVGLVAMRGAEGRVYCSGVWVASDAILTANHCVDDFEIGERVSYVTRADLLADAGDELEAVHLGALEARDEAHDLALVRVRYPPDHLVAHVVRYQPYVGEITQTMGHPLGLWYSYSTGVVAAIRLDETTWYVQSTAPISPGNSGGALFDDHGDILGIAHAYVPRGENLNLFIHAGHVSDFLRDKS